MGHQLLSLQHLVSLMQAPPSEMFLRLVLVCTKIAVLHMQSVMKISGFVLEAEICQVASLKEELRKYLYVYLHMYVCVRILHHKEVTTTIFRSA